MYKKNVICVIVPAYNEELLIEKTLAGIPEFVDYIVVVDDASTDLTFDMVSSLSHDDQRVTCIRHEINRGVGGAISTGYIWCRENNIDIAVVMAGDNQMDPDDLPRLLDPVAEGRVDYSKGNRLLSGKAWIKIPRIRYLGNAALSFLTKIASGYWHVTDSQTGYTALNAKGLSILPLEDIYPRYGMPNDFLVTLNIYNMRVVDVPVEPVYGNERSDLKISQVLFSISFLLLRLFIRRMVQKYIIRDFHPLVLFYALGVSLLALDIPLLIRMFALWIRVGSIPNINFLTIVFCTVSGLQLLLFAMLFDMQDNRDLRGT